MSTLRCESNFNASAIGDSGDSIGIVQASLVWNPTITKKEALDPKWSLEWAANVWETQGVKGAQNWSCYKLLQAKYGDGVWPE